MLLIYKYFNFYIGESVDISDAIVLNSELLCIHRLYVIYHSNLRTFQKCFSGFLGGFLLVVSTHEVIKHGVEVLQLRTMVLKFWTHGVITPDSV